MEKDIEEKLRSKFALIDRTDPSAIQAAQQVRVITRFHFSPSHYTLSFKEMVIDEKLGFGAGLKFEICTNKKKIHVPLLWRKHDI